MSATSFVRGWPVEFRAGYWAYADTGQPIDSPPRPCPRCGRLPTPEGYDACLGHVPGCTSACCGHGRHEIIREPSE